MGLSLEILLLKKEIRVADRRNPCLECDKRYLDKNNYTCAKCVLRINYVKGLDYFTDTDPTETNASNKTPLNIKKDMPQIDLLLQHIKESIDPNFVATCKKDGCNKTKIFALGFCKTHYNKDLKKRKIYGGCGKKFHVVSNGMCIKEGCDRKHHALGYCEKHYKKKLLISLQINRKVFNDAVNIISPEYNKEISNNKMVENILRLFIQQKGIL